MHRNKLPVTPARLRAEVPRAAPAGVDRINNRLLGYVVAQLGVFKDRRGEFDLPALKEVVRLTNSSGKGLKSRFTHPTLSEDGLGKFLGRATNARMGTAVTPAGRVVPAVRADLTFDRTAMEQPPAGGKPYGVYIMDLAESDPEAMSSSLVLDPEERPQLDERGKQILDAQGEPVPPLWWPKTLHASDMVDTGDAVDGLLSPEQLAQALSVGLTDDLSHLLNFDRVARLGSQLLDGLFRGQDRDVVRARCLAWLDRYLSLRFGTGTPSVPSTPADPSHSAREYLDRLAANILTLKRHGRGVKKK